MSKLFKLTLWSAFFALTAGVVCAAGLKTAQPTNQLDVSNNFQNLSKSYQVAGLQWLPDFVDSEFGWSGNKIPERPGTVGDCKGYSLSGCPKYGFCSKCAFDEKFILNRCEDGYLKSDDTCTPQSCDKVKPGTKADVPSQQVCTIATTTPQTCYSDCRSISCTGYTLTACPSNANCTPCPDCQTTSSYKGNCSSAWQKVTSCKNATQTVNPTATACINKDDSCPSSHPNKSCSYGSLGEITNDAGNKCYSCKSPDDGCPAAYPSKSCSNGSEGQVTNEAGNTCYKCKLITSCEDYIKSSHPDFTVITDSYLYSAPSGNAVLMNNASSTTSFTIGSGKKFVGPRYFANDLCLKAATPTISFALEDGDGITLKNATLANMNVEYKPEGYVKDNMRPSGYCNTYSECGSSNYPLVYSQIVYAINNGTSLETIFGSSSNGSRVAYYLQSCKDGYSDYKTSCDDSSYSGCRCSDVGAAICEGLSDPCKQNKGSAVAGYGTMKDVSVNISKNAMDIVVSPDQGDLIIEGTVKIFGDSRDTPLRVGSKSFDVHRTNGGLIVNGLLDIYSDRGIYNSGNSNNFVVNKSGTLKISYGSWEGILHNAGRALDVYGTLDISSHGSGGGFNNDLDFYGSTVLNAKANSKILFKNGAGGHGTFNFEKDAQLSFGGTCKKATSSGSTAVRNSSSNNLYGAFTSHPSEFSASCSSSAPNTCGSVYRTCSGSSYRCGSDITDCDRIIEGTGNCFLASTCK